MNYENGSKLLPSLEKLKDKTLLKSTDWDIIHVALLPIEPGTFMAYVPVLDGFSNGNWMANGVNHQVVYLQTGLYTKPNGTHFDDDLTFFALIKKRTTPYHCEYKAELIFNLVSQGEIRKEDIPSSVLPHL